MLLVAAGQYPRQKICGTLGVCGASYQRLAYGRVGGHARGLSVAGTFWGVDNIKPGAVLDLDVDQMEGLLKATTLGGGNKVGWECQVLHGSDAVLGTLFGGIGASCAHWVTVAPSFK